MADIEKKQKELLLDLDEDMDWNSGLGECPGVDAEMPDYVKECLEEELAKYINDKNNYVVEGAIVECDHMSKQPVQMYYTNGKLGIKGEGGSAEIEYKIPQYGVSLPCFELDPNETEIRAFHAINANQDANGLRFATILDRSCLRDKIEKENMEEGKDVANLISMGNCKIMLDSDVLEINNRKGRAKIFGTCYCLMKPDTRWVNPYCMEGLVENYSKESAHVKNCYVDEHHHTMNWDTDAGQKEGLTRLSTLLCTRGGIITFTWSGQSSNEEIDDIEERIKRLIESVEGESVDSSKKLKGLSTMEILSRLIYQEDREFRKGQNAVLFSIVNRLFSTAELTKEGNNNNIYSVIAGLNQYESIMRDGDGKYSAFRPPASEEDGGLQREDDELQKDKFDSEEEAWANAKRLAAILYIAIEDYGEPCEYSGENERKENIVIEGDNETYQEVINFIQQQQDTKEGLIINEIGTRDSFQGYPTGKYLEEQHGGNYFNWY